MKLRLTPVRTSAGYNTRDKVSAEVER